LAIAAWLLDRPDAEPKVNWIDAANAPVTFEANQGQTDAEVRFLARAPGYTAFFTPDRMVSTWQAPGSETQAHVEMRVVGADKDAASEPLEKQHRQSNYFLGNDPAKWQRHVPHYGKVKFKEVYNGIDLVYHSPVTGAPDPQRTIEYDFVVSPGIDPSVIELSFEGVEKVSMDDQGGLLLATAAGAMRHRKPTIYQEISGEHRDVSGAFRARGERSVGFEIGDYDREHPLVIDPVQQVIVLDHSSYLGGSTRDDAVGIVLDADGNSLIGGWTTSANFPIPTGAAQDELLGSQDMFFTRVSADGTTILNSTFLGGSSSEEASCIAVDDFGNAHLVGFSNSPNFPTTFGLGPRGAFDATITVFNPDGSEILLSTTLGGPAGEDALGCSILSPSGSNNIWLATTGRTNSSAGFPVQGNSFQPQYGGGAFDGFVNLIEMEFDPSSGELIVLRSHSTFLGGTGLDVGEAIVLMDSGSPGFIPTDTPFQALVTPTPTPQLGGLVQGAVIMTTNSTGLPVGSSAFQDQPAGGADFYIATFSYSGGVLNVTGGTYIGGSQDEFADSITAKSDSILVTGSTTGTYPTTPAPFQPPTSGASISGVVSEFDIDLTELRWSSHVGGNVISQASDAVYTQDGCATVVGQTLGDGFTPTPGAILANPAGGTDGFVIIVCDQGRELRYATLVGGPAGDSLVGVATDPFGNIHAAGVSGAGWPTTSGAFQPSFGGPPFDATTLTVNRAGPFLGQRGFVGGGDFQGPPGRGGIGAGFGLEISDAVGVPSLIPLDTVLNDTLITFLPPPETGSSAPLSAAGSGRKSQNAPIQAPLLFVSPNQLNFQVPWEVDISSGTVRVVVTSNGVDSAPIEIAVQEYAPQIFSFDFGPGRAVAINPDGSVAHPENAIAGVSSRPAVPGDILTIFATGLGPTEPPAITGDDSFNENGEFVRRDTVSIPTVFIGGVEAQLQFSGMSPEFVGVQQVNVFVPEGVNPADEVSLVIEIEGLRSREDVTIAVAAAS
jgi:uncharacterized protein (TIGR03437 family)